MEKADWANDIHVFGISHPNFAERYQYIRKHLSVVTSAPWEIVGVDGRELASSPDFINMGHSPKLTPGQIGCSLAHCQAYSRMRELGLKVALVVEDDVRLPENIDLITSAIAGVIRPGEVISLHNPMMEKNRFSRFAAERIVGMQLICPMSPCSVRSASAYMITLEAAEAILQENIPAKHLADHWDAFYDKGLVKTYRILHPSPCRWLPFESSIGYGVWHGLFGFVRRTLNANRFLRHLVSARRRVIFWKRLRNVVLVDEPSPLFLGRRHD